MEKGGTGSIQFYLKCQLITIKSRQLKKKKKEIREIGSRAKLHAKYDTGGSKGKLNFNRQKPQVEADSVETDICRDRLGGRGGEER